VTTLLVADLARRAIGIDQTLLALVVVVLAARSLGWAIAVSHAVDAPQLGGVTQLVGTIGDREALDANPGVGVAQVGAVTVARTLGPALEVRVADVATGRTVGGRGALATLAIHASRLVRIGAVAGLEAIAATLARIAELVSSARAAHVGRAARASGSARSAPGTSHSTATRRRAAARRIDEIAIQSGDLPAARGEPNRSEHTHR